MSIRLLVSGDPVNDGERQAFDLLRTELERQPDDYGLCTNISLPTGRNRLNEIDAIVVAPSMIFVIEVKTWGGRITLQRERWFLEDDTPRPNPSELLSRKAKELKAELERYDRNLLAKRQIWVQELIYVNGPNAKLIDIDYERRTTFDVTPFAFTNATALISAIVKSQRWARTEPFSDAEMQAIDAYLVGGTPRPLRERIANYVILEQLAPTSPRIERYLARDVFATDEDDEVELHLYPLDNSKKQREETTSLIKRQLITLRALAESRVVPRVREPTEVEWNKRAVIVLPFESLTRATPFADILASARTRGLKSTLRHAVGLADALAALHAQGVVHGALEPGAIVLRDANDPASYVLRHLELARPLVSAGVSLLPASTITALASLYASPFVLQGGRPSETDDVYSFGALFAQLVFGKPIFANAAAALAGGAIPRERADGSEVDDEVRALIADLLARTPSQRPASMREVALRLDGIARRLTGSEARAFIGEYEVIRELRAGATGRTVVARRRDQAGDMVLKIATNDTPAVDALIAEVELLLDLRHENIVVARAVREIPGGKAGEYDLIPGEDLARMRGRIEAGHVRSLIYGLFAALGAVHARGLVHRDVKPANVMLKPDGTAVLLDFGLAAPVGDTRVEVGTAPYKSPNLFARGSWSPEDDVFAAVVTLWESIGGTHPWRGAEPAGEPAIDAAELATILDGKGAERFAKAARGLLTGKGVSAGEASRRLVAALGPATPSALELALEPTFTLDDGARLGDLLETVDVSRAVREALAACNVVTLDDARRLRTEDFLRVRTMGRASADEAAALVAALRARFGDPPPEQAAITTLPAPLLGFAPVLIGEPMRIDALGLPAGIVAALSQLGRHTVGDLAALRPSTVQDIPELGPSAEAEIRAALARVLDDREGVLVDAAMPDWRCDGYAAFVAAISALGLAVDRARDVLETAGGGVLTDVDLAWAPPWTDDEIRAFVGALATAVAWPPQPARSLIAAGLNATTHPERYRAFGEDGLERAAVTILEGTPGLKRTNEGGWYRVDAVSAAQGLAYAVERLRLPMNAASVLHVVRTQLPGVRIPNAGTPEANAALAEARLTFDAAGLVDRVDARTEAEDADPSELVEIERSPLARTVDTLLATRRAVSFRLLVTEPGPHVALATALLAALRAAHGVDRVHAIDVDAALCHRLEADGVLGNALRRDARGFVPENLETFAGRAAREVLRGALVRGRRDDVTVLYNLGGLVHTKALGALRDLYEDARGGTEYGLIVVCVPGDHPREHARLNRSVPLVVTGSDPILYLEKIA